MLLPANASQSDRITGFSFPASTAKVLVAQHQAEDPLSHQRLDLMLDVARVAPVGEALGEPTHQPETAVHLPQQQRTRIRGDIAAIETGHHRTPFNRFKLKQPWHTLCQHRDAPGFIEKPLLHNNFLRFSAATH